MVFYYQRGKFHACYITEDEQDRGYIWTKSEFLEQFPSFPYEEGLKTLDYSSQEEDNMYFLYRKNDEEMVYDNKESPMYKWIQENTETIKTFIEDFIVKSEQQEVEYHASIEEIEEEVHLQKAMIEAMLGKGLSYDQMLEKANKIRDHVENTK